VEKYGNPHGQLKKNLFLPLFNTELYFKIRFNYRFDNTRGKTRDILILQRITKFSTTGSAGLKRRNNGRNMFIQCYGKIYSIQHYVIKIGSELRSGNPDPSDFILLEWSGNE
jgi:hypothetical protein